MRIILFYMVFVAVGMAALEAQPGAADLDSFSNHGEVYFKIRGNHGHQINHLPTWISPDGYDSSGWLRAYATRDKLEAWMPGRDNYEFFLLPHPGTLIDPVMRANVNIKDVKEWDFYPTYDAFLDIMLQFEQEYPDLCEVFSIGQSVQGRDILMAVISGAGSGSGEVPQLLYSSSIHGDETTGYVLFLRLIDHLLSSYETNPEIQDIVDGVEIWIAPLANPDGTYAGGNSTVYGATRFNANGVDLNRNYPDPEDGNHPDGNAWQPETILFMELAVENNFVMGVNCHGGTEVFNYPWDTWPQLHADNDWWYFVAREWADSVHYYAPPGYFDGYDNGITNGYQWYSISGGRQDYMNYFHHCREFTLEISDTKLLPAEELPDMWTYNHRSFLNYLKQAFYGLRGLVSDAGSGTPLSCTVYLEDHDLDHSWVVTNEQGWFYRPLHEGTYDLSFFSPGYETVVMEDVQVENYSVTQLNVELAFTGSGTGKLELSELFTMSSNPVLDVFRLNYLGTDPLPLRISIHSLDGRLMDASSVILSPGNSECLLNLDGFVPAVYLLSIESGNLAGTFKLIKK
jgi:hypothetical protein